MFIGVSLLSTYMLNTTETNGCAEHRFVVGYRGLASSDCVTLSLSSSDIAHLGIAWGQHLAFLLCPCAFCDPATALCIFYHPCVVCMYTYIRYIREVPELIKHLRVDLYDVSMFLTNASITESLNRMSFWLGKCKIIFKCTCSTFFSLQNWTFEK